MLDQRQQPQRCYLDDCENHERDRCNVMAIGLSMSARDARDHSERSKSSSTFWMSDFVSHPRSRRGSPDSRIIMSTSHRHPRQVAMISSSSQTHRSELSYRDFAAVTDRSKGRHRQRDHDVDLVLLLQLVETPAARALDNDRP